MGFEFKRPLQVIAENLMACFLFTILTRRDLDHNLFQVVQMPSAHSGSVVLILLQENHQDLDAFCERS